jgi:hypothetical protein
MIANIEMQPTACRPWLISALLPDAARPATTPCGYHPLLVRRYAPHNQRIHLSKEKGTGK